MVHPVLGAFTAIAIIQGCVGGSTGAYKTGYYFQLAGHALNVVIRFYGDTFNTTITEFITSPTGVALLKAGKPVGPRESRLTDTSHRGKPQTAFIIKNVTLSDGGLYHFHMYGHEPDHLVEFNLMTIGRFKCNKTTNHTAVFGGNVTYACTAKYQGILKTDVVKWSGAGVSSGTTKAESTGTVPCKNAKPDTCFTGKATYSLTIPVTFALNNTYTAFKVTGMQCAFEHTFGTLTVICQPGSMGKDCAESMGCKDNPCLHGGTCSSVKPGSSDRTSVNCSCTAQYVGDYCERPKSCKDVNVDECKNNTICYDNNEQSPFACVCAEGYAGTPCVPTNPTMTTTMKTKSAAGNTSTTLDISATNHTNCAAVAAAVDAANAAATGAGCGTDINETEKIVFLGELELDGNESSSDVVKIAAKSSSVSFVPFLSLLLIPLVAATVIAVVIIFRRRHTDEDEDDDESDDLSSSESR